MDIREIGARPPPPGRVASQAPAATPAASGSDDELPLSALRRKPAEAAEAAEAAVTGTKRPRAALPTAPPRGPAAQASAAGTPGSSRLPPSASQPLRDRLSKAWHNQAVEHGRLLAAYQRSAGEGRNGADLMMALTEAVRAGGQRGDPTDVAEITLHAVKLSDDMPEVQLACWNDPDGSIADVRLLRSRDARQVATALRGLKKAGRNRAEGGQTGVVDAAARNHLRNVYRLRQGPEMEAIVEAWHRLPGQDKRPDYHVMAYLHGLTKAPGVEAQPTDAPGIRRFSVQVPGMGGPLDLLVREQEDGSLGDLRVVPESSAQLPWLVRVMERGAAISVRKKTSAPNQGARNPFSLWRPLQKPLGAAFKAFQESRRQKNERVPAAGGFVSHLDALCREAGEGTVVDAEFGIRRYTVRPEGSDRPVTLLRREDERGVAGLRVVADDLSDVPAMADELRRMARSSAKSAATASAAAAAVAAGAIRGAADAAPAAGPVVKDAWQLKRALELALENQARGGDLLAGVAEATGVGDAELRRWIAHDGALIASERSVARLRGYHDLREDFEALFLQLGQPASAARLPGELTASMMLRVMKLRLEDPEATLGKLCRAADVQYEVARRYFEAGRKGSFFKANSESLRRMPDYAEHREALQEQLVALREVERAKELPPGETRAETFLRELDEQLYPLRLAIAQWRSEPGLSAQRAARRVSTWPRLADMLERLVGPGGELRDAHEIARDLQGFEPGRMQQLDQLLARLAAEPPAGPMTEQLMPAQGVAAAKVFIVREPDAAEGPSALRAAKAARQRDLRRIFAGSPDQVVPPRSYREERAKQSLRWLSTFLRSRFDKATEVQAYWEASRGELWVSSNDTGTNAEIEKFLQGDGLARALENLDEDTHASRETRHASRLKKMMNDESARPAQARGLLQALFSGRVRVPTEAVVNPDSGLPMQMHAERRIKRAFEAEHGKGSLDRRHLAGTMRPCGICARDLDLPDSARRGPFWMSRAALQGHDLATAVERDREAGIGTSATKTRDGKLTIAYNTDSDDGSELDEPRAVATYSRKRRREGAGSRRR